MRKLALVFPGQGTQFVGMGLELYANYPQARQMYERADDVLGYALSKLCFEGPQAELDDTANTQPAVYVTTLALWQLVAERVQAARECANSSWAVAGVAGHSLGEFSALAVSGALTWEDGLRLVRARAVAMRDAGLQAPGGMAAIIGLPDETVAEVVAQANAGSDGLANSEELWIANYNAPGQVAIAGQQDALQRALALAKERGAKRALPLAVSVAAHTPLMRGAAERLATVLEATPFQRPWAPVVQNATASATIEPHAIKAALLHQLTSPVRWVDSVRAMLRLGVGEIVEVGPRSVLAGLIKRIDESVTVQALTDAASLQAYSWEA
jgi:[acyl-carrier-protein] S-malonyltransferase